MPSHCAVRWGQFAACVGLALLLIGCEHALPALKPLADLHLPGVTKIPGITNLHSGPGRGVIDTATAYPAGDGTSGAHALFTVDGDLYDVSLDGSAPRSLALICAGSVTVTADGRWAACDHNFGVALTDLTVRPPDGGHQILAGALGNPMYSPTWAPDGHHLAVATHLGSGCAIAFYSASPGYDSFAMTALLDLPEFVTPGSGPGCSLFGLAWSPDGSWLALVNTDDYTLYRLSLASFLPQILQSGGASTTLTVTPDMLTRLSTVAASSPPAWSRVADGLALTFVGSYQRTIVRMDMASRQQTVLLRVDEGVLRAVPWTPDSHQLVFVLSQVPRCPECAAAFTPSHLYVFTPPS
jgi:Tol biopolymer transport system component